MNFLWLCDIFWLGLYGSSKFFRDCIKFQNCQLKPANSNENLVGILQILHDSAFVYHFWILSTVKSRAVDWSTIQFWDFLAKGHIT